MRWKMRTTTCRFRRCLVLIAGALVAPAVLWAQPRDTTASRTHVVRSGETLWRLAAVYLGAGRRWPEIQQLNQRLIVSPSSLVVGSTIRIPAVGTSPTDSRSARSDSVPARPTASPVSLPAQPAPAQSRTLPQPPSADTTRVVAGDTIVDPPARTIFFGARPGGGFAPPTVMPDSSGSAKAPDSLVVGAVRWSEAVSAPFIEEDARLQLAGRCVSTAPATDRQGTPSRTLSRGDRLTIEVPRGASTQPETRFVLARRGEVVAELGEVMVPTAIVRVIAPSAAGAGVSVEILSQFELASCDDLVLPIEVATTSAATRPVAVLGGAMGRVIWVARGALLPTLQHHIIVDIGAGAGLSPGAQVTVVSGPETAPPGVQEVAIATIVRVGQRTSSALVIRQTRPLIQPGMSVRVTAKLP